MEIGPTVDKLRSCGEVWISGPVREQRRLAKRVVEQVPAARWEQLDPETGIRAYTEPTPGTETRIYLPSTPPATASMGSVIPRR